MASAEPQIEAVNDERREQATILRRMVACGHRLLPTGRLDKPTLIEKTSVSTVHLGYGMRPPGREVR
jgi:hypothetical protein